MRGGGGASVEPYFLSMGSQGSRESRPTVLSPPKRELLTMKRREFLKSSLAASVAGLASVLKTSAAEQSAKAQREFYELRLYHLRRGPKQKLFDDFYREASIPAMNRAGIWPVAVC